MDPSALPEGWLQKWSTKHARPYYIDLRTSESHWQLPESTTVPTTSHEGGIDPGLIGHAAYAVSPTAAPRPFLLQGSLWTAPDPAMASLTPWHPRDSPTSSLSPLTEGRTSVSSDGDHAGYAASSAFPYRYETDSAFTDGPLLTQAPPALARPSVGASAMLMRDEDAATSHSDALSASLCPPWTGYSHHVPSAADAMGHYGTHSEYGHADYGPIDDRAYDY